MTEQSFEKLLSANDVGATGSHQAGILVPKGNVELLTFFPLLDVKEKNPDAWITCEDEGGQEWQLRYIYYNSRIHGLGTRNEFRLTHLTKFLKRNNAKVGDVLRFTATTTLGKYTLAIVSVASPIVDHSLPSGVVRLSGWRRVH